MAIWRARTSWDASAPSCCPARAKAPPARPLTSMARAMCGNPDHDVFHLNVPESLRPITLRNLGQTPPLDQMVDGLPMPDSFGPTYIAVHLLRWYRRVISPRLGIRCVLEPSCSRYAEVAFRNHGAIVGLKLTISRLLRCRPGKGGVDTQHLGEF
ncbi:membrane protein insertion efficiency factor YidD [Oceanicaulis sp.]|uniref:membrane protein insertion efficiency factor YidD n=1 Tax=Oceanicaulis sp. TaxID=1924941 RepID=UPI003F704D47